MLVFNEEDNDKLSKVYVGESIMEEYMKAISKVCSRQ